MTAASTVITSQVRDYDTVLEPYRGQTSCEFRAVRRLGAFPFTTSRLWPERPIDQFCFLPPIIARSVPQEDPLTATMTAIEEQRSEKYRHALIAVVSIGVRARQLGGADAWLLCPPGISRMNMPTVIKLVTCRNSR